MRQTTRTIQLPTAVAAGDPAKASNLRERVAVISAPTGLNGTYQLQVSWGGDFADLGAPLVFAGPGVQHVEIPFAVESVRWNCTAFGAATGDETSVLAAFDSRSV